ncbi:hypothetical protein pb186bvf_017404 [Paramecium bursaria]
MILLLITLVTALPTFYHTTDEINEKINSLVAKCPKLHKQSQGEDLYTISMRHQHKKLSLIIFGEHARELITVELAYHFLKDVCQHQRQLNFIMVVNMNPGSRRYVEQGHYCLRESVNGVDINRNYDINWKHNVNHREQTSSGDYPFSEPSSSLVRDLLKQNNVHTFMSIHSGTSAILLPYAYKRERAYDPSQKAKEAKKICKGCLLGGASEQLKYTADGASLDYAYDVAQVEESYTLEIYRLLDRYSYNEPETSYSEFVQNKHKAQITAKDMECFNFFNPDEHSEYREVLQRWSEIINILM